MAIIDLTGGKTRIRSSGSGSSVADARRRNANLLDNDPSTTESPVKPKGRQSRSRTFTVKDWKGRKQTVNSRKAAEQIKRARKRYKVEKSIPGEQDTGGKAVSAALPAFYPLSEGVGGVVEGAKEGFTSATGGDTEIHKSLREKLKDLATLDTKESIVLSLFLIVAALIGIKTL